MSKLIRQPILESERRKIGKTLPESTQETLVNQFQELVTQKTKSQALPISKPSKEIENERVRVEEITKAAKEEGYESGYIDGKKVVEEALKYELEIAEKIVQGLRQVKEQYTEDIKKQMVLVVHEAVLKIVGKELFSVAECTLNQIHQKVKTEHIISIGLNQSDYEHLSSRPEFSCLHRYMIIDARVKLGGCIVEMINGGMDGRLETQLEELTKLFSDYIEN